VKVSIVYLRLPVLVLIGGNAFGFALLGLAGTPVPTTLTVEDTAGSMAPTSPFSNPR
jgi:hypothetical protein